MCGGRPTGQLQQTCAERLELLKRMASIAPRCAAVVTRCEAVEAAVEKVLACAPLRALLATVVEVAGDLKPQREAALHMHNCRRSR